MKVIQLIKKVNNTEIGAASTHESYLLVNKNVVVEDVFETENRLFEFTDKITGNAYDIRLTSGRERRIVGLGQFYSDNKVSAGDDILIEKVIRENGDIERKISISKHPNSIFILKKKYGFDILNPDRLKLLTNGSTILDNEKKFPFALLFKETRKKRSDSPITTNFYKMTIDGIDFSDQYATNTLLELLIENEVVTICECNAWKKLSYECEE